MTDLALWTWIAVGVLVTVPPVVFALFLRDARRVFRALSGRVDAEAPERAEGREAA